MAESNLTLVAGATGALGRHVVREVLRRGHRVKALVNRTKLPPPVVDQVDVCRGDALDPSVTDRACSGVDVVFSCLGASVSPKMDAGRRSYDRVDTPANLNLLDSEVGAGVTRFVYVSVAGHEALGHLRYVSAHEAVVRRLTAADIEHSVVRPPGFFSAFEEFLQFARSGPVPIIGDATAKTNPIHDLDLAEVCVDAIEGAGPEVLAGGTEVLTRRRIAELALEALGRPLKVRRIPPGLVRLLVPFVRPFNPRVADITAFYADVSVRDLVVPSRGTRTLSHYFHEMATSEEQ